MGPRNRNENGDDHEQHSARRQCVAEERDCFVTPGELLGHDPGADDCHNKKESTECLCHQAAAQIETHSPPLASRSQRAVRLALNTMVLSGFGCRLPLSME